MPEEKGRMEWISILDMTVFSTCKWGINGSVPKNKAKIITTTLVPIGSIIVDVSPWLG